MKQLKEIWQELSDKGSVHSYVDAYEQILKPYRETAMNVLEIGLFNGNSLRMWEQYFTNASVHGIDCDEQPHGGMADLRPMILSGKHNIHILDGTSEEQVDKEFAGVKFNVVWDDGSHLLETQLQTINKDKWVFDLMSSAFDVQVIDLRSVKGRYDDCLIIIKNKA